MWLSIRFCRRLRCGNSTRGWEVQLATPPPGAPDVNRPAAAQPPPTVVVTPHLRMVPRSGRANQSATGHQCGWIPQVPVPAVTPTILAGCSRSNTSPAGSAVDWNTAAAEGNAAPAVPSILDGCSRLAFLQPLRRPILSIYVPKRRRVGPPPVLQPGGAGVLHTFSAAGVNCDVIAAEWRQCRASGLPSPKTRRCYMPLERQLQPSMRREAEAKTAAR